MEPTSSVRMDKWLWSVRLYKTRTLAAAACDAGRVRVNGQPAKPSRSVHPGEIITAVTGEITRTVKVLALLGQRVGAARVPEFIEDLTPPAELQKPRPPQFLPPGARPRGAGRPTKRDRRILQSFFGEED
jgi:ribosome-associated heat shock protein Hsp15